MIHIVFYDVDVKARRRGSAAPAERQTATLNKKATALCWLSCVHVEQAINNSYIIFKYVGVT
jgi:hypothetical protein